MNDAERLRHLQKMWEESYRAFCGAFDTPAARMKQSDDFANDARERLRAFHDEIMLFPN